METMAIQEMMRPSVSVRNFQLECWASHMGILPRSFKKKYPVAVRGEGVYLWDSDGNRYLDFAGSAAVNFIGHGQRKVIQAIAKQAEKLEFVHSSQFVTEVAEQF